LTLSVFARATQFQFITYDDHLYVADNPHVLTGLRWSNIAWAFTTWHTGNWHPLTWLSLMLDAQLFGKSAAAYHTINILLHTANSVLLFFVLLQFTGARLRSAFVAALFAVHPLHIESVAWVSERKDLLSAFFFLLTLALYWRYTARPTAMRYILLVLLFIFGLLAKPMLVTLPFILLLLDVWPLRRHQHDVDLKRLFLEKIPLLAVAAAFSFITFFAQRSGGATMPMSVYPLGARLQNALLSYERYLAKIFWPHDLTLPYPFPRSINPLELCWAAALLIAMTVIAVSNVRRRRYLFTGWFWFVGMLVPVIGLVQVGPQAMADRYMYLPLIGISLALTWGFADATSVRNTPDSPRRRMRLPPSLNGVLAAAVLLALSWVSSLQLGYWNNSETLFRHSLAINPRDIVALRNLATEYADQHRPREAIACLESLLSETSQDPVAHFHLGQMLRQRGDDRRAIAEYESAVALSRDADKHNITGSALNNLAWIRATSPDPLLRDGAEAVRLAERSCNSSPSPDVGQLDTLAAAYAEAGDFSRALGIATRALEQAESDRNETLRVEIANHIELFRKRTPIRERVKNPKRS
jgi:hypothetical protein